MRKVIVSLIAALSLLVCVPAQTATASGPNFLQIAQAIHTSPFLVCVRHHESDNNPADFPLFDQGYGAVNPSSFTLGAYQFEQSTWNSTVAHYGLMMLYNVRVTDVNFFVQDVVALLLRQWQGASPWSGSGCY